MTTQELIDKLRVESQESKRWKLGCVLTVDELEQIIKALEEAELIKEDMLIAYRYGVEKGKEE